MELMLNDAQVAYAEAIIEAGLIDIDEVNQWLGSLTEVPLDLGEGLCQAGLVNEFELTRGIAKHTDLSVASDIELDMYATPHPSVSRDLCVELLCIPLSESNEDPFPIALTNPLDEEGLSFLCELIGVTSLKVNLAAPSHIRHEINACYGDAEEWARHLAEQGIDQDQVAHEASSARGATHHRAHLRDEAELAVSLGVNDDVENEVDTVHDVEEGRPRTLPDWSAYQPHHHDRHTRLRQILIRRN